MTDKAYTVRLPEEFVERIRKVSYNMRIRSVAAYLEHAAGRQLPFDEKRYLISEEDSKNGGKQESRPAPTKKSAPAPAPESDRIVCDRCEQTVRPKHTCIIRLPECPECGKEGVRESNHLSGSIEEHKCAVTIGTGVDVHVCPASGKPITKGDNQEEPAKEPGAGRCVLCGEHVDAGLAARNQHRAVCKKRPDDDPVKIRARQKLGLEPQ